MKKSSIMNQNIVYRDLDGSIISENFRLMRMEEFSDNMELWLQQQLSFETKEGKKIIFNSSYAFRIDEQKYVTTCKECLKAGKCELDNNDCWQMLDESFYILRKTEVAGNVSSFMGVVLIWAKDEDLEKRNKIIIKEWPYFPSKIEMLETIRIFMVNFDPYDTAKPHSERWFCPVSLKK